MKVDLTPDQEARLAEYSHRSGLDREQVVRTAVEQFLNDSHFAQAVEKGFASLDRGEFLEHEEVGTRLERLLRP